MSTTTTPVTTLSQVCSLVGEALRKAKPCRRLLSGTPVHAPLRCGCGCGCHVDLNSYLRCDGVFLLALDPPQSCSCLGALHVIRNGDGTVVAPSHEVHRVRPDHLLITVPLEQQQQ